MEITKLNNMKKICLLFLILISNITFSQTYSDSFLGKYDKMADLFNHRKDEEAKKIADELLSGKYGEIDPFSKFFTLFSVANYYYQKDDYQKAYDFYQQFLDFNKNENPKKIDNKKIYIDEAKGKLEELKPKLALVSANTSNTTEEKNVAKDEAYKTSETKSADVNIASEISNSQSNKKEMNTDKIVTLTATGTGKTIEEARLNAMRSAIEQAFGAFVSSKTEILNDNLVKDEIVSVANGNIQKYEVVSQIELPNIGYGITINATVSIDKLKSFAESKGVVVEFKGGMFGATIKLQKLNEEAEVNTIYSMIGMLHENMQLSFDYNINALEPKSKDAENKFWEIPITIDVIPNSNMKNCAEYLINTLKGISLNQVEVENYKTLNKSVFPVEINFNGLKTIINLRKQISNSILLSFARNFDFYTKSFEIQTMFPDINNKIYDKKLNAEPFYYSKNYDENILEKISFPSINKRYTNYNYTDLRSLSELEKIDKYTIIPIVKSKFKEGGYVIFETSDGHGLVCSLTSMVGEFNFYEGETIAKEANFANYKDWYIPNKEEFKLLNKELDSKRLIEVSYFWTSSCWNQITSTEHFENITNCKLLPFAWRAKNTSAGNRLSDDMYCPKDEFKNTVRLVRKF